MEDHGDERPEDRALRAQLLATEHWGLLAARGTTQSELLTRISILLTLVSATLVTVGLLGQATGFRSPFPAVVIGILAFDWVVGVLTQVRVLNAGEDDQAFVTGMNRIRAGYVALDPGLEQYLVTAAFDDLRGVMTTYSFVPRHPASQVLGSSSMIILLINASTTGVLTGTALDLLFRSPVLAATIGAVTALGFVVVSIALGARRAITATRSYVPLRPHGASVSPGSGR